MTEQMEIDGSNGKKTTIPSLPSNSVCSIIAVQVSILSVLLGLVMPALAQPQFDHWTTDHGLPQNSVNAIIQTHDGYLWMATNNGLARFDGVRFTVFDRGNTPGIASPRLVSLYEDQRGVLWIGADDGVLIRHHEGVFTSFGSSEGLPADAISHIEEDEQGNLWLHGQLAYITRWRDGKPEVHRPEEYLPGRLGHPQVYDRIWWSVDNKGLHLFSRGRRLTATTADGLPSLAVRGVYPAQHGAYWITTKAGLTRLEVTAGENRLRTFGVRGEFPVATGGGIAWEDGRGSLWLMVDSIVTRLKDGRATPFPAVRGSGFCLYEDREGTLWIGLSNGLYRLREPGITAITMREGLVSPFVYSILADRSGAVWIGAWGGGLARWRDGRLTIYLDETHPELASSRITSLYEDRRGRIWIGAFGGVSRFEGGRLRRFSPRPELAETWAMHEDRAGDFWFGTSSGLLKKSGDGFTLHTAADGLPHNHINAILEDHSGVLWVGTDRGVARRENERWVAYTERDGLPSGQIRCLYEDAEGTIWIGSYDGGLGRWNNGQLTRYTLNEGLYNNGAFQILEDDHANLWISCNRGVYRIDKRQFNDLAAGRIAVLTPVAYGAADGMPNAECNGGRQPSGWKMTDGRLWFPTMGGVAIIDPAALLTNPLPPPVIIEQCRLNQQPVDWRGGLQIPPGQDDLEIEYSSASFIKPDQIRFRYRLSGLDEKWVEAGGRRTAYYPYLPPGEYFFTVLAANSDGVWNERGASLRIVVDPPFWRRWWFLGLSVGICLASAAAVYRRRVKDWRRERETQEVFTRRLIEAHESERTRLAAELHDSLNQELLIIRNRALLGAQASNENPPAQEQFVEITTGISRAIDEVREIAYNLRPYHLDRFGLAAAIEAMVGKVAGATPIRFTTEIAPLDGLFSPEAETSIYRIVQEGVNNILKHSQAQEARIEITRDEIGATIRISDDGCGFAPEPEPGSGMRAGLGLTDIAERVRWLGGSYYIHSAPESGTTLVIRLTTAKD